MDDYYEGQDLYLLSEDWIKLFWNVILFVTDSFRSELKDEVRIRLSVDVHGVKVVGLDYVHANQNMQRIVGW